MTPEQKSIIDLITSLSVEADNDDVEKERKEKGIKRRLEKSNIPPRFIGCTLDSLRQSPVHKQVDRALAIAGNYCNHWPEYRKEGKGIVFLGHVGRMKTSIAVGIGLNIIEQGSSVYFVPMAELLDELLSSSRRSYEEHGKYVEKLRNVSLLILDDFGTEYPNDWVTNKVDAIISYRYNHMLPIIITSNLSPGEIASRYQERIFDRLRSTSFLFMDPNDKSLRESV